jgi:hypothetical protein
MASTFSALLSSLDELTALPTAKHGRYNRWGGRASALKSNDLNLQINRNTDQPTKQ